MTQLTDLAERVPLHRSAPRLPRISRPVDVTDADRFPNINAAIEAGKADVERWAELQREWEANHG